MESMKPREDRHLSSREDVSTSSSSSDSSLDSETDSEEDDSANLAKKQSWEPQEKKNRNAKDFSTLTVITVLVLLILATSILAGYFYLDGTTVESTSGMTEEGVPRDSTRMTSSSSGKANSNFSTSVQTDQQTATEPSKTRQGDSEPSTGSRANKTTSNSNDSSVSPTPTQADGQTSAVATQTRATSVRCRKGVGYNQAHLTKQLDICWAYNWDASGSGLGDRVMYVPMLWGEKKLEGWRTAVNLAIDNGATHALGFNEPDLQEQANLSPSAAASLWSSAIEPLATEGFKLVSPAVSNGVRTADGKPMGVPWLLEFMKACTDCTIDAVALHWYDAATNFDYFQTYIEEAHAKLFKPIWLTEFMGIGSATDQASFLTRAVEWLEKQEYIEAYAAFGDFCDNEVANFVDCSGTPNSLGVAYSQSQ